MQDGLFWGGADLCCKGTVPTTYCFRSYVFGKASFLVKIGSISGQHFRHKFGTNCFLQSAIVADFCSYRYNPDTKSGLNTGAKMRSGSSVHYGRAGSSPASRTSKKSLKALCFQGFFLLHFHKFSLIFSLILAADSR